MLHNKQRTALTPGAHAKATPVPSATAAFSPPAGPGNRAMLRLQRKCDCGGGPDCECEPSREKHKGNLHRAAAGAGPGEAPPIVHDTIRSSGQVLDPGTRAFFESRFARDFSGVRVHADSRAGESARAVNALAYTVGPHIAFAPGQYQPQTVAGRRLLAHELTHVIQQPDAPAYESGALRVEAANTPAEREAEANSAAIAGHTRAAAISQPVAQLQRQEAGTKGSAPAACVPAAGIPPSTCSAYLTNLWWLPLAYVNNATCACQTTPNVPTANCVRKFLQDRLAATSTTFKLFAAAQKALPLEAYEAFVEAVLTPRIYQDHVDAYRSCCCPSGPAPYADWMAVTAVPIQPCSLVGWFINHYGSCSGTPGTW